MPLLARFGGAAPGPQAEARGARCSATPASTRDLVEEDDELWSAQRDGQRARPGEPDTVVRVAGAADRPARRCSRPPRGTRRSLVGRAPLGLSWLRLADARRRCPTRSWTSAGVAARAWCSTRPAEVRERVDPWGERDAAVLALMRRVKDGFDPAGVVRAGGARVSAFDQTRPPSLDLIDDCVHCGFCLPTCPTYRLWGEEMDSPRGRIVLMKQGHEEISAPLVEHIDNCLGCMACVTACPSGVQYDKLIEDTRAQVERNARRPPRERAYRRLVFALFTHPGRLRAAAPAIALAQRLGLTKLAARPSARRLRPSCPRSWRSRPTPRRGARSAGCPERFEARGERRGTVALLQGCVQRVFFGHVNEATARVLAAEGFEVHAPRVPRCCGALQLHAGDDRAARASPRRRSRRSRATTRSWSTRRAAARR